MNQQMSSALAQGDQTPVRLIVEGKQEFMGIEIPVLVGGFGENNKVVTDKSIAEIHSMEVRHVRENINNNIKRFKEGIDLIDLKKDVGITDNNLLEHLGYSKMQISKAEHIYILSERGYSKLIKIMDTDLAWEIHDKLVDDYFTLREAVKEGLDISKYSPEMQAILMHDEKLTKVENRVNTLENNMFITRGQKKKIRDFISDVVKNTCGSKYSNAYKELKNKVYSEVYRKLYNYFEITSFEEIPRIRFQEALNIINAYKPTRDLELMIKGANHEVSDN